MQTETPAAETNGAMTGLSKWQRFSLQGGAFAVMSIVFVLVISAGLAIFRNELSASRETLREENRLSREERREENRQNREALKNQTAEFTKALQDIQDYDRAERDRANQLLRDLINEVRLLKK